MVEHHAAIGGEGNGSVAIPAVHSTHDAAAAMVFLLEHLARSGQMLSTLVAPLPRLTMVKEQVAIEPHLIHSALQAFRDAMPESGGEVWELADGIRVEWPDGWVHVRASNTESIIRIIAEAETDPRARDLVDWARDRVPGARQ
jgi:phosphomannomutase